MKLRNPLLPTAIALLMATSFAAQAQSPGSTGGVQGGTSAGSTSQPATGTGGAPRASVTGSAAAGSTNAAGTQDDRTFSAWLKQHAGRISRSDYMAEMGRRWDAADASKQGLTSSEIQRIYGGQ